ncbi:sensor histidine kinase [Frigoribacterium sp. PhB24]|uniref:sensor histidine kinase n=1 Tax=Frigoribacterium sp. PhB24 TaxID=2485204 RepID=UPI000F47ABBA|nr:sensor histidine kinase [Frigoribacterium sp. PhB24]ROS54129.1 signal transduction histidine kinase [Frigoribacterium sp. PhB24]
MAHTALTPVFVGLRTGLHVLVVSLVALVIGRAALVPGDATVVVVVLALVFLATYALGALARTSTGMWLVAVSVEWIVLVWLTPEASYLVFPLFFLYLHLLGRQGGTIAVGLATAVAVVALGVHGGWTVGGVIGPVVGAGVAVMIGMGYQALSREAVDRERLVAELIATRDQLAASERESGVLAERGRLAREIHDTVAQGLSSIQLLLHAAERADPDRPGIEHLRLARETAAANLADTRQFIRDLTPPALDERGLGGALRRMADTEWAGDGLRVIVRVGDSPVLPMHLQTALLRIAQGAMANIRQHAGASTATIELVVASRSVRFTVADDGRGFDADSSESVPDGGTSDSFGLRATRERVEQLGGALSLRSSPGRGTILTVELALDPPGTGGLALDHPSSPADRAEPGPGPSPAERRPTKEPT